MEARDRSPLAITARYVYTENSDALFNTAVGAGAKCRAAWRSFLGHRSGAVADPSGYTWWIPRARRLHSADAPPREEFFKKTPQHTTRYAPTIPQLT